MSQNSNTTQKSVHLSLPNWERIPQTAALQTIIVFLALILTSVGAATGSGFLTFSILLLLMAINTAIQFAYKNANVKIILSSTIAAVLAAGLSFQLALPEIGLIAVTVVAVSLMNLQCWKAYLPLAFYAIGQQIAVYFLVNYTTLLSLDAAAASPERLIAGMLLTLVVLVACALVTTKEVEEVNNTEELESLLEHKSQNSRQNVEFAKRIMAGIFDDNVLVAEDEVGQSLMDMRASLKLSQEKEQSDKFINVGLAEVSHILRINMNDVDELADQLVSKIVNYLGCNQAGLFLLEMNDETKNYLIHLKACYAYEKKKFFERTLNPGEGLVGQCVMEKDIILLTDVPQGYTNITSGLGDATPRTLLLLPLMNNEQVVGVLELASFKEFFPYEVDFLRRVGQSIASTIVAVQNNVKTRKLLEHSYQMTQQLQSQEEELRQNMEELQATQEEIERRLKESDDLRRELGAREKVLDLNTVMSESDLYGNVTYINDKFCEVSQFRREELVGQPHKIVRHVDMPKDVFKLLWETIKAGRVFRGIIKNRKKNGGHYWVDATIAPILDENGRPIKFVGVRYVIEDEVGERLFLKFASENNISLIGTPFHAMALALKTKKAAVAVLAEEGNGMNDMPEEFEQ